jgi:hypothetical protein
VRKTTAKGKATKTKDPLDETVAPVKTTKKVATTKKKTTTTTEDPFTISLDPTPTESLEAAIPTVEEEPTTSTRRTMTSKSTSKPPNIFTINPTTTRTKYVPQWTDPSSPFPFEPSAGSRTLPGALLAKLGIVVGLVGVARVFEWHQGMILVAILAVLVPVWDSNDLSRVTSIRL